VKELLVTLAAVLVNAPAFGQGTINFNNLVPSAGIDASVYEYFGLMLREAGAGTPANAQLFLVTGTSASPVFTPLSPATTFRGSPPGPAQGYVIPPAEPVIVPNVPAGQQAFIVLRAWEGSSYDTAVTRGQSSLLIVTLGGEIPGQPPLVPANLVGLQSFTMGIPEPSSMAFWLLGAAALLSRRCK
jgi:hypothetical protein